MEVGEEEEDEEEKEWIIPIPLIDLRSFADDELWKLAVCSSSRPLQDIEQQHIPVPKINKAVFNESAGSKRQTYRKWDLLIQETNPTPTPTQELLAAAQSTTGVSSSLARKMMMMSTTILQSSSHQQETIMDNGHQCKIDQKHQGLKETGGRDSLQGALQVETTLLESKEVAAAGRGDSGIVLHLNRREGGSAAISGQKRRQPNDADHHHHHRGDGASAHSLHQLHKSLKSTQKQSPGEEEQHHQERVSAHGSAELSMAAGMMMSSMGGHLPPPPAAASLGQQNNPDVVESEPEIYAEMMKQQLKRKNGTWMTTVNMDGKVMHAQGFPKGWTVSVGLRHKTGRLFYEYKQWKSPDGKIWGSFKEAAVHMVHMLQQEHFFNVIAPPRRSCPVCEQLDPSLIHLTHCCPMRDPEWICKVCDRIFSNLEALQIHQSAHASTNQLLKDPLKASTGSRNPFEVDIASTPETNPVACGNGGSYSSSHISCHTCTTPTDHSRWICKICDTVYSNSEALRIHENGHALASQMLTTKRLITDSGLQNTNCKGHHGKILSEQQGQQESESKREGDKTHRNLTSREDGLTKRDLLEGMMVASQNHQRQLLQRSPIGSREECLCISCDAEQQKANSQSKQFGSSQHLSSFSHTDMLCSNNLHIHSEVAPSNSLDPIYEENPVSADVSNSSDASNYSEELLPKGFHGFQMGLDENGTHVGGGYPKVQSTAEDEHGGAFESPTCHEHFHKASLFNDHLASLKTRRKKPTQVLYNSEIMGSMETLRTNFDQSITGLDMKSHLEAKLENESASVQGQPMQEIFWRMIQNSAHVGTPNGTHTSNATVTAFLEKEKAEDMQHGMKTEIFEEDEVQYAELHQTINTNIACTEAQAIHTALNMQSQYSSDEGGAEQDEHHKDNEFESPAQSPYEEGDCYICGTHEKGAPEQVYCDCCGAGFHWSCVTSELQPVPEGSWMCPECEIEHF